MTARALPAGPSVRTALAVALLALVALVALLALAHPALAQTPGPVGPTAPTAPTAPATPTVAPTAGPDIGITVGGGKPGTALTLIIALTVLSVAPSVLLLMTSFTKIIVVLSLTRNALGLQTSPPNQVLTGLALFLTLFVMHPVFNEIYHSAVQPYLAGQLQPSGAYQAGVEPLRTFMLAHTRDDELRLMIGLSGDPRPANPAAVQLTTLVPAFLLSELKSAFIIGMVIFIPFLVLDMLVSATLMAMGMVMVPPVIISLPFKLLLFVLVDGWSLITQALVGSYR